ncbi:MAG: DegT/DnrJ/EryC1/StrS family aminotransferase [Egibacteraceae bacterium]
MTDRPAILGGAPAFPDGLPLVRPTLTGVPEIARRLERVLESGILTNGPNVRRLEETAAEYMNVRHVVAVASCTSGLMLALVACGIRGKVVVPSFTFSATAHAVHWAGGTPVFADIDAETLTLDPADATPRLADADALMATHLYGTPCDVEGLQAVADAASVPLVYDAAHALGSRRKGKPVGGFGTAEVFSLSPTKVAVAGEGGLVATNDDVVAEACRLGRDYGNPGDYNCRFPGLNARMSELHAVVGLASLDRLDDRVAYRNKLVDRFRAAVEWIPGLSFPVVSDGDTSTYKDLTVLVDACSFGLSAAQLAQALRVDGIDSRRYYHPPVHRQDAYARKRSPVALPVTDRVALEVLSPPLWSHMTESQIDRVADAILRIQRCAAAVADALGG